MHLELSFRNGILLTDAENFPEDSMVVLLRRTVPSAHPELVLTFFDTELGTAADRLESGPTQRADIADLRLDRSKYQSVAITLSFFESFDAPQFDIESVLIENIPLGNCFLLEFFLIISRILCSLTGLSVRCSDLDGADRTRRRRQPQAVQFRPALTAFPNT